MPKKAPSPKKRRKRWTVPRADIVAWLPVAKFVIFVGVEALRFLS